MRKIAGFRLYFGLLLVLLCSACASHRQYVAGSQIRARARQVAVLPLVNLTMHPNAGKIIGDLLTTELYAATSFQIMERTSLMDRFKAGKDDVDRVLDKSVVLDVGKRLGADTVIFGSVTEYRYKRGLDEDPVVGINLRMLDVETGKILWAAGRSQTGGCFWFCEDSLSRLAQKVCNELVVSMARAD